MAAGDVVLKLTMRTLEEGEAFSGYLTRFLDRLISSEPPFMMVSSEPFGDSDLRTVIFQQADLAAAFSQGWETVRGCAQALQLH